MEQALQKTASQILTLREKALQSLGEEEAQIFEIHGMLLEDEDLLDALKSEVADGKVAEDALESTVRKFTQMFDELNDPYLSARAADMKDIAS